MTTAAGRRVAKLEGALQPREAVLAWLVEAQQYPSLEDHVRSIVELPVEAAPLSVIGDRVEATVRDAMRGQPRDPVEAAVRRAVGDGVFLFTLAIVLNAEALEVARVEGLRATAVFFWIDDANGPRRPPAGLDVAGSVEDRVADRVARLADDARVRAYETLGERLKAVQIMERRLRAD